MTVKAMTAEQLTKKIINKEPIFLLDVRNESDVQDWKIEGKAVEYLNVPYFELLDGVEDMVENIPDDLGTGRLCERGLFYYGGRDVVRGRQNGPLFARRHEGME